MILKMKIAIVLMSLLMLGILVGIAVAQWIEESGPSAGGESAGIEGRENLMFQGEVFLLGEDKSAKMYVSPSADIDYITITITEIDKANEDVYIIWKTYFLNGEVKEKRLVLSPWDIGVGAEGFSVEVLKLGHVQALLVVPDLLGTAVVEYGEKPAGPNENGEEPIITSSEGETEKKPSFFARLFGRD